MGTTAAQKEARVAARRNKRNKSVRSQVKTNIIKAEKLIFAGELEAARAAVINAVSALDRAASKGIIHSNNAARRRSRLLKKLVKAQAGPPAPPQPEKPA